MKSQEVEEKKFEGRERLRMVDWTYTSPRTKSIRFQMEVDAQGNIYFNMLELDEAWNVVGASLDRAPWTIESFQSRLEEAKARIRLGASSIETKSHLQLQE